MLQFRAPASVFPVSGTARALALWQQLEGWKHKSGCNFWAAKGTAAVVLNSDTKLKFCYENQIAGDVSGINKMCLSLSKALGAPVLSVSG